MSKIIFIIPDGVGFKNFGFINKFYKNKSQIKYLMLFDVEKVDSSFYEECNIDKNDIFWLNNTINPITSSIFQIIAILESFIIAKKYADERFLYYGNKISYLNSNKKKIKDIFIRFLIYLNLSYSVVLLKLVAYFSLLIFNMKAAVFLFRFFSKLKPDKIICTHQRSTNAVIVMLIAYFKKISTSNFIYSWDNLPKGGSIKFDSKEIIVWSDFMKNELLKYYINLKFSLKKKQNILILGNPSFSILNHEINLICNSTVNKYILFTGDDFTTSPYDDFYLESLALIVERLNKNGFDIKIFFRRNPSTVIERYNWVLTKYKGIIVNYDPCWFSILNESDWRTFFPKYKDFENYAYLISQCFCVVNIGSTTGLDFALVSKPVIYLKYKLNISTYRRDWNIDTLYNLPHFDLFDFKYQDKLKDCFIVNNVNDLYTIIQKIMYSTTDVNANRILKELCFSPKNSPSSLYHKLLNDI